MNKENKEATAQNSKNSMSLDGRRLAKLKAINADLLAALEAAAELAEGTVKLLRQLDMESGRIAAECVLRDARAAIARATGA